VDATFVILALIVAVLALALYIIGSEMVEISAHIKVSAEAIREISKSTEGLVKATAELMVLAVDLAKVIEKTHPARDSEDTDGPV
jgi:predicted Holliday junction resolvase-like endonuclease